jgi:PPOX class probable F420-dependent enzyme
VAVIDPSTELGARIQRQLETEIEAWMTTISADGTPQPNLIWFVLDGDDIIVYSHKTAARNANIARNNRVSLNFNSDPDQDHMSVIIGTAVVDDEYPRADQNPVYQAKYGDRIPGIKMTPESHADTFSVVVRITPTKIRGW